jgi:hypothetical protein
MRRGLKGSQGSLERAPTDLDVSICTFVLVQKYLLTSTTVLARKQIQKYLLTSICTFVLVQKYLLTSTTVLARKQIQKYLLTSIKRTCLRTQVLLY